MDKKLTEAKTTTEELNGIVGLIERINSFIKKNGLKGTFTSLLTLFIAATVGFFILNPGIFFEKFNEYTTAKHEEGIKQRLKADPEIRSLLSAFRSDLNADRAYILEAHNGGSNLTNLPFLYADLTYMDPRNKYDYIETEYKNFRLSRYPWASYVMEHGWWFGTIEDCMDSDPELYYRLQKEDVKYMGMFVMHGKTGLPSACLGVIYKEGQEIPNKNEILRLMQKYGAQINSYLIY